MNTQHLPRPFRKRMKRARRSQRRAIAAMKRGAGPRAFDAAMRAIYTIATIRDAFAVQLAAHTIARARQEGVVP